MRQILILAVGLLLLVSLTATSALAMTKSELIEAVAKESGQPKEDTKAVIESFFDVTTEVIEEQGKLVIGFNDISRIRFYLIFRLINTLGFLLGADHGDSIMCVVDEDIAGKEVRFGDGIVGSRPPPS